MELALMNRFVASCGETRELLSDYAEGELDPRARRRVGLHLLTCRRCRAVLRSLKTTIRGLNALGKTVPESNPATAESVMARIQADEDP